MSKNHLPVTVAVALTAAGILLVQKGIDTAQAQTRQPTAPTATRDGRFQIIFSPSGLRADTFLLDTQTGRAWRKVQYTDLETEPDVWKLEDRVDSQAEPMAWAAGYRSKK
jgi:hypothetical protein